MKNKIWIRFARLHSVVCRCKRLQNSIDFLICVSFHQTAADCPASCTRGGGGGILQQSPMSQSLVAARLLFFKGASMGCSWEVFFYNTLMVTDHRSGSFKGTKRCSLFMGGRVLQHPPAILNFWCRSSFRLESLCNVWWGWSFPSLVK